ncbi:MAG: hypothetical protein ACOZFS_00330 [Thermodesulfobacteriota bacterium]
MDTISIGPDGTILAADSSEPTGVKWVSGNGSGAVTNWGTILGNLSDQNDLQNALNGKEPASPNIQAHIAAQGNPHGTTKAEIGLANVTDEAQIPKSIGTAKGSLVGFSSTGTPVEVPVGADNQVLTADSTQPYGVAWADVPGGTTAWGNITGTLENQTDLQTAFQTKSDVDHLHIPSQVGLSNVTNDAQVKKAPSSIDGNLVTWSGTTGDTVADSGKKISDLALASHVHTGVYEPANANIQSHLVCTTNPHNVTANQVLPGQTGKSGKFLTTDGSTVSWGDPTAGTPPAGTGFRHVTAGAEDSAAKLVANADVAADAAIAESKLGLNYPTHSSANDPASGEKAALAGTSGTPGTGNKYVTDADPRNTNARTPTAHGSAAHTGTIGTPAQVGLGNVPNLDTSNPANITQDSTHRFVTDAEKSTWNGKQDPLGFTAVPDTRTVAGHPLSADVTISKSDVGLSNVTNDAQVKKAPSSIDGNLVTWSGTTGDMVADSGKKISDLALASHVHTGVYEPANANIQSHLVCTTNPHNVTADQVLPGQTGKSGKFLTTDGSTVSWGDPTAGTPPAGTGFRHVTAGAEDSAAKLVANADVAADAAIAESKLGLNYPTHSSANDPASGEKAALAGTSGTPGTGNKYVTDADPRNTNARTPTAHGSAAHTGTIGTPSQVGLGNVTNDAQVKQSIGTAKGSLIGFSASGTPVEVPVGDDNKVLTADSSQPSGVAWKTPTGAGTSDYLALINNPKVTVGATGYGSTIQSAITAIGSSSVTLVIPPGTWAPPGIFPDNISLEFVQGAVLDCTAVPHGAITAIEAKDLAGNASTTRVRVTAPGHGLESGDWVRLYGIRQVHDKGDGSAEAQWSGIQYPMKVREANANCFTFEVDARNWETHVPWDAYTDANGKFTKMVVFEGTILSAPKAQIFSMSSPCITFGAIDSDGYGYKAKTYQIDVYPEWFGAKGDWSYYTCTGTDDYSALYYCLQATDTPTRFGGRQKAVIHLSRVYKSSDTLSILNCTYFDALVIKGSGRYISGIVSTVDGYPAMEVLAGKGVELLDFYIEGRNTGGGGPTVGLLIGRTDVNSSCGEGRYNLHFQGTFQYGSMFACNTEVNFYDVTSTAGPPAAPHDTHYAFGYGVGSLSDFPGIVPRNANLGARVTDSALQNYFKWAHFMGKVVDNFSVLYCNKGMVEVDKFYFGAGQITSGSCVFGLRDSAWLKCGGGVTEVHVDHFIKCTTTTTGNFNLYIKNCGPAGSNYSFLYGDSGATILGDFDAPGSVDVEKLGNARVRKLRAMTNLGRFRVRNVMYYCHIDLVETTSFEIAENLCYGNTVNDRRYDFDTYRSASLFLGLERVGATGGGYRGYLQIGSVKHKIDTGWSKPTASSWFNGSIRWNMDYNGTVPKGWICRERGNFSSGVIGTVTGSQGSKTLTVTSGNIGNFKIGTLVDVAGANSSLTILSVNAADNTITVDWALDQSVTNANLSHHNTPPTFTPIGPITGTFTMAAANSKTVANAYVGAASDSKCVITFSPVNAAAATLMGSAKCLYEDVAGRIANTSFIVKTANGTNAVGTEIFYYKIDFN